MPSRGKKLTLLFATLAVVVLVVAGWIGWPWLQFHWRFESLGVNAHGLPEYRHRQTGIIMVRLPGGTFWMGAQKQDSEGRNYDPNAEEDESPVHEVTLSPFLIAKLEVTQAQWKRVMGSDPSYWSKQWYWKAGEPPVEQVSWADIQEFEVATGLGLPTEAQWEYACRAGSAGVYCFGDNAGSLGDYCWYTDNSGNLTHPVGQKPPNKFGLHDMHGNVWEWCDDSYNEEFYSTPQAAEPDRLCTSGSTFHVIRGGGWRAFAQGCRSAFRVKFDPGTRVRYLGFRPAAPCP